MEEIGRDIEGHEGTRGEYVGVVGTWRVRGNMEGQEGT